MTEPRTPTDSSAVNKDEDKKGMWDWLLTPSSSSVINKNPIERWVTEQDSNVVSQDSSLVAQDSSVVAQDSSIVAQDSSIVAQPVSSTPRVIPKNQKKETNLTPVDINVVDTPKDKAVQGLNTQNDINSNTPNVGNNGIQTQEHGKTAESILNKAINGGDITNDIRTIVGMHNDKDSAIWETDVFGHAYGPFQLFDVYTDDLSMKMHHKPTGDLNRYEQYQVAREHYDRGGWSY